MLCPVPHKQFETVATGIWKYCWWHNTDNAGAEENQELPAAEQHTAKSLWMTGCSLVFNGAWYE
jgi:hypothetical protein